MRAWYSLGVIALTLACSSGPVAGNEGSGSKTNWWIECDANTACQDGLTCICGVCSTTCGGASGCEGLSQAVCPGESHQLAIECGMTAQLEETQLTTLPEAGICIPSCGIDSDCDGGVCVRGGCVQGDDQGCALVSEIQVVGPSEFFAREGSIVGDDFHVAGSESYTPLTPTFRALDETGVPVANCELKFATAVGEGWAWPVDRTTNEEGLVSALWLAGSEAAQTLRATAQARDEQVQATVSAEVRPHSAEPLGDPAATPAPNLIVQLVPPTTLDAMRVRYVVESANGDYMATILANDDIGFRLYPAALGTDWAFEIRTVGSELWSADDFVCSNADARRQCTSLRTLVLDQEYEVEVEFEELALDETPSIHEFDTPCETTRCVDYVMSLRMNSDASSRIAVIRVPDGDPSLPYFSSLIPLAGGSPLAESCLETQEISLLANHEARVGSGWEEIDELLATSPFSTEVNSICGNYALRKIPSGIEMRTGGNRGGWTTTLPNEFFSP